MDWTNIFYVVFFYFYFFTDADNFEPEEPIKKAVAMDKWEGEDEEEDVKVHLRDKRCFGVVMRRAVRSVTS